MPPAPPSFGSQEYWNKRFTSNSHPFEWLEAPTALDPHIIDALKTTDDPDPQLLHVGCGTSLLSFHLRAHVERPGQVHNLDYSDVAIEVGRKREAEIFKVEAATSENSQKTRNSFLDETELRSGEEQQQKSPPTTNGASAQPVMRWSSANLLDHASLLEACKPSTYAVVVDKSTSDSIACSDDLYVPLPYHIVTSTKFCSETALTESSEPLHPLHIMAVHLALVTKPRGRWISLSYSTDRYPFLHLPAPEFANRSSQNAQTTASASPKPQQVDHAPGSEEASEGEVSFDDDLDEIPPTVIDDGFPDPSTLWKLVGKYDIEPPTSLEASNGNVTAHRPKVFHWIYVLERTDVPLFVRTRNHVQD